MRREVYQHKWMSLCESEQGIPFIDMTPADGTMAVPLTDTGDLLLLTEYSAAYDERVLFLPAGGIETGESAAETANRELQEEAGYKAARLDFVGEVYPFVKYLHGRISIYLARDLSPSRLPGDEEWTIEVESIPFARFEELIACGRLRDSSVIAALYMARAFLQKD